MTGTVELANTGVIRPDLARPRISPDLQAGTSAANALAVTGQPLGDLAGQNSGQLGGQSGTQPNAPDTRATSTSDTLSNGINPRLNTGINPSATPTATPSIGTSSSFGGVAGSITLGRRGDAAIALSGLGGVSLSIETGAGVIEAQAQSSGIQMPAPLGGDDNAEEGDNQQQQAQAQSQAQQQPSAATNPVRVAQEDREPPVGELTAAEQAEVRELQSIDREVRAHERAHQQAGGNLASPPQYEFVTGPDGRRYAVAGTVQIRRPTGGGSPGEQIEDLERVIDAALAPAQPSTQDRAVAAQARADLNRARAVEEEQEAAERAAEQAQQEFAAQQAAAEEAAQEAAAEERREEQAKAEAAANDAETNQNSDSVNDSNFESQSDSFDDSFSALDANESATNGATPLFTLNEAGAAGAQPTGVAPPIAPISPTPPTPGATNSVQLDFTA